MNPQSPSGPLLAKPRRPAAHVAVGHVAGRLARGPTAGRCASVPARTEGPRAGGRTAAPESSDRRRTAGPATTPVVDGVVPVIGIPSARDRGRKPRGRGREAVSVGRFHLPDGRGAVKRWGRERGELLPPGGPAPPVEANGGGQIPQRHIALHLIDEQSDGAVPHRRARNSAWLPSRRKAVPGR